MSSGSNDQMGPVSRCSANPPPLNAKGGSSKEHPCPGSKEAEEGQDKEKDKENQNENKIENDRNNKRESDGHGGREREGPAAREGLTARHPGENQNRNANESKDGNGNGDENDNKKDKRKEKRKGKRKNKHKTEDKDEENAPLRKPCCFCWCCCCSCSWRFLKILQDRSCLAVKSGEDDNTRNAEPNPLDLLACDGEPPPSLEEIRSWGRSFDKLMKSPAGRKVFRDFLRCEYSEENILFWLACEELKKEQNPDAIEEKARFIYEDYISILSPKEVSLDSRVRELVNKNMVDPTPCTFDEAQLQIYTLMHRDSYPRFVNSAIYRQIAQLDSNNGNGSQQASPARSVQLAGGGGGSTVSSGGGGAAGTA